MCVHLSVRFQFDGDEVKDGRVYGITHVRMARVRKAREMHTGKNCERRTKLKVNEKKNERRKYWQNDINKSGYGSIQKDDQFKRDYELEF